MKKKKVFVYLLAWFLLWQSFVNLSSIYTSNDDKVVFIKRPDIGRSGDTTYYSYKPWEAYHEKVTLWRFLRTSIAITVDKNKRVTRLDYSPSFFQPFQKHRTVYMQNNGTVAVWYNGHCVDGYSYEEFEDDFEWAKAKVDDTRLRFAHLIPEKFRTALSIKTK